MLALNLLLIALIGYLCGSIPTSVWVSKKFYGFDLRERGSGNAGATNAYRVLGWKPALFVVFADIAKGLVPTHFAVHLWLSDQSMDPSYLQLLMGVSAMLGHVFTLFAGFRGGKGVATAAGMLLAIYPLIVPFCFLVFILVVITTRYVSLASMCAAATLPIGLGIFHFGFGKEAHGSLLVFAGAVVLFIVFTHRANIHRLLEGNENKIGS